MMTDVRVSGYICEPNEIEVGAAGSYGVAKLRFLFDDAWDGLSRRVTWMTKTGKISTLLDLNDCAEVPPEALETAGRRWFSVDGTAEGKKLITARCVYRVRETVPPGGENSAPPTPDEMEQMSSMLNEVKEEVVAAADRAEAAANGIEETRELAEQAARVAAEAAADAEDVAKRAEGLTASVETAVNDAKRCADEAKNNASIANKSSALATEAAETAEAAADRAESASVNTPKIVGGTWWVFDAAKNAYVDTGVQAKGEKGDKGNGVKNIAWVDGSVLYDENRVKARSDTYCITFDDGSTFNFTVNGGADGTPGAAGAGIRDISFIEETEEGYLYNAYVEMTPYPIMVPRGPKGADGKETVLFVQDNEPTEAKVGDLWFDTDEEVDEPSGGASSWNDLTDKPFGESFSDTLTWDGNTDGLVSVDGMAYKISDATPSVDEVMSGSLTATVDGETGTIPLADYPPQEMGSGVALYLYAFLVVPESAVGVDIQGLVFPEAGLYVVPAMMGAVLNSLTIPGYTGFKTETINTNCIPDTIQRTITGTPGDFVVIGEDGNVTTGEPPAGGGETWRKVFETTLTEDIASLYVNKDMDGNDFALKKFNILVRAYGHSEITNRTYGIMYTVSVNGVVGSPFFSIGDLVPASGQFCVHRMFGALCGDWFCIRGSTVGNAATGVADSMNQGINLNGFNLQSSRYVEPYPIKEFRFPMKWGANTVFELWGVDA